MKGIKKMIWDEFWYILFLFAYYFINFCCRTPRGCVDWNDDIALPSSIWFVAPHAGAWIEMIKSKSITLPGVSRTPRGCVDWNYILDLCGVVTNVSHPTRVRGLKSKCGAKRICAAMSHPTRVRGLKQACRNKSADSRILYRNPVLSHPTQRATSHTIDEASAIII